MTVNFPPKVGFCKVPDNLDELPSLCFANGMFKSPSTLDLRDYCTKTEDQGNTSMCAAYTAAGFAENILWRMTDVPQNIDPVKIYRYAKSIDGDPNGEGTTLTAVGQALLDNGIFDKTKCAMKVVRSEALVRYAIHKFGCCLGGFNITEEWYGCDRKHPMITGRMLNKTEGGHAVLICGYTRSSVIIQNSWGTEWGHYGFGMISWEAFRKQFMYGVCISNVLDGMTI